MSVAATLVDRAGRIAEEVLFPAALDVDATGQLPTGHLELLAKEGFYGVAVPADDGGPGIDLDTMARIVEVLAGGCLTTAFVWLQHHSAVRAVAESTTTGVRRDWLDPLSRGARRAGVCLAGVRPGNQPVRATAVVGGYRLDGFAPWITGWGMIDTLLLAARCEADDTIVWALLDPVEGPTLAVEPLDLVAVAASRTVHARLHEHFVPAARVTGTTPYADWSARDAAGLRINGSLSLGLASRCRQLIADGSPDADAVAAQAALATEIDDCRALLDAATVGAAAAEPMPVARAAAAALALRAAATLAVTNGSRSVLLGDHAQRLLREAAFLLVFGSRPPIRRALLRRLAVTGTPAT